MDIKIDSDAVASIAATAVFDALNEETREGVLKDAIKYLLTPDQSRNAFGSTKLTPLQNAFNDAIRSAAFKVVREKVENDPEVIAAINELLGPLLLTALKGEASVYSFGLSEHLGNALGQWLGEQARKE